MSLIHQLLLKGCFYVHLAVGILKCSCVQILFCNFKNTNKIDVILLLLYHLLLSINQVYTL